MSSNVNAMEMETEYSNNKKNKEKKEDLHLESEDHFNELLKKISEFFCHLQVKIIFQLN